MEGHFFSCRKTELVLEQMEGNKKGLFKIRKKKLVNCEQSQHK